MPKLLLIVREEIRYHLRQGAFYLAVLVMPLVFAAVGAFPRLQSLASETPLASVETVFTESETITVPTGYVDHAGLISQVPEAQADKFYPFTDEASAAAALQGGEIESYYVIEADYIQNGGVVQYSAKPQLLAETDTAVRKLLREMLLQSLGQPELAARLAQPVVLVRPGPPPPVFRFIPADLDLGQLASAGLVAGLFAYVINVGGNLLVRALQREQRARVLEMLVVSTTPAQFIGGKLLGLTLLSLVQVGVTLLAGVLVYGQNPDGSGPSALPLNALLLSLPYLLLGYLAYSGALIGIAAIWPTFQESGPLLAMLRLLVLSPLIGVLFILPHIDGPISIVLTLLPMTSPLLMPFRLLLGTVPLWQWTLGGLFLTVWTAFWIWLSIRLFRIYGLLTGLPVTPQAVWQALRG